MRMESGRRPTGLFLRLTAGAFLCLGVTNPARTQTETAPAQPAPAAQTAGSPIVEEPASPSQVFPDGGFPTKPAAEGAIPDTTTQPGPAGLYAPLPPPSPDYSRAGVGVRPIADYAPP